MARLTIKDQQARYNQLMKGYEEGKKAGLTIAAGDHQGGAYRKPHLEGADHDYIKELYQKRQNPKNPLDGDELPGGDMQLKLPLAKKGNPLTIAGLLLPGETPEGGKGGLGSMNKDQLERWIKENGITGPAADKIRKKWGGLGPQLPLAHNYRPGPTGGSMYNELMIRANQLMNSSNPEYQQRGLELLKISPQLYKLESLQ